MTAHIPLHTPWRARLAATAIAFAALPALADSPFARYPPPPAQLMNGVWNGVDLERRSGCANAQNDGTRGTYAQFTVATDASGLFSVYQSGITGLTCTYGGHYTVADDGSPGIDGTYGCSDGKQGSFHATTVGVNGVSLSIQMHVQLTGSETCSIEAILGMSRFYP